MTDIVVNHIIRQRIRVSLAAYMYEFTNDSLMTDLEFDQLAKEVYENRGEKTGHDVLDEFFRLHFVNHSGVWIHKHPELHKLIKKYRFLFKNE